VSGKVAKGYATPTGNGSVPNQAKAQFSALIDPAAAVYLSVVSRMTPVGFKPPKRRCRRH